MAKLDKRSEFLLMKWMTENEATLRETTAADGARAASIANDHAVSTPQIIAYAKILGFDFKSPKTLGLPAAEAVALTQRVAALETKLRDSSVNIAELQRVVTDLRAEVREMRVKLATPPNSPETVPPHDNIAD